MTKFSVAMCVYEKDNPVWFKDAVESVINQTIKPNEIIIVVDGPVSKELDNIIEEFAKDKIFNIIKLEKNEGHGNARRCGLLNCKNDLVALMDSDDISLPFRFEKQIKAFEDETISLVGGQIAEFIDSPESLVSYRCVKTTDEEIKKDMKKRCPINQPSVMFKKSDINKVGGYIDWYCNEDYYLWIRMAIAGMKMINLEEVIVKMRINSDSFKRRGGFKYFNSEKKLQRFMLHHKIINFLTYTVNVVKRFIVQVLLPNKIRSWVYKKFARRDYEKI